MNRTRLFAALVAVALVSAAVGLPTATAAPTNHSADLAVEQPNYVDSRVHSTTVNGTNVYTVKGEVIDLKPTNFNSSNVVDYGVTSPAGKLRYESAMGTYELDTEGNTGTFDVFWVVEQKRAIEVVQNNTTTTKVVTQRVRYSAVVRVKGMASMDHYKSGALAETKSEAAKWQEVNATVQKMLNDGMLTWKVFGKPSTQSLLQSALSLYKTTHDPIAAVLNGSGILLAFLMTGFGIVWFLFHYGFFAVVIRRFKKRINIFESIEDEEGDISDRVEELSQRERERAFANIDWNKWFNDYDAENFREFGETPAEGYEQISNGELLPETWLRERVGAMGLAGYSVAVPEPDGDTDVVADGGTGTGSARILGPDETPAADEVEREIDDLLGDGLLDILDWEDEHIEQFNLPEADVDTSELDIERKTMDLDELLEVAGIQYERFDSMSTAGTYLHEFVTNVRQSEMTDDRGRPDDVRLTLNKFLRLTHKGRDEFDIPLSELQSEAVERALIDHSPGDRADEKLNEVRTGKA